MVEKFDIKIYSDSASLEDMCKVVKNKFVSGFTTNPSLMKKAGIVDYVEFAKKVIKKFPDYALSLEVLSNDQSLIIEEARLLHSLGRNVYVKIPIVTVEGESTASLIHKLSSMGIALNVTAVTTERQVQEAISAFVKGETNIISIFVGRIADVGIETMEFIRQSVELTKKNANINLLWASTREVSNVYQAQKMGVDIITVPPEIIKKLALAKKTVSNGCKMLENTD
ncbi:transaldolase family protein [Liquorilactobacillus satsumensis]|uniref:transaldolase family protein n=1 Tax=Liquorilactobacillus satsumensis TaxID=259059 RepID=UPI0039EC9E9E